MRVGPPRVALQREEETTNLVPHLSHLDALPCPGATSKPSPDANAMCPYSRTENWITLNSLSMIRSQLFLLQWQNRLGQTSGFVVEIQGQFTKSQERQGVGTRQRGRTKVCGLQKQRRSLLGDTGHTERVRLWGG